MDTLAVETLKQPPLPTLRGRNTSRATLAFWLFIAPVMLGLLVFVYAPLVWGFILSFFAARNTITPTQFVGVQNYISMLQDTQFLKSLLTFTVFAIFIVPTTFFISLGLALLVNSVSVARGFFRSVFFIPTACSYVVASLVWKMSLFNGLPYGIANIVRGWVNLDPIAWVTSQNPPWYWLVLVTVRLWLQVGFYMILFIAGLQEIPSELYEAASVDGTNRGGWNTFRHITFPLLRATSISVVLLLLIAAFQAFDEFYNILGNGLGSSGNAILAQPPLVYLYTVAIGNQNYGLGSAGAFILTALIIVFTLVQGRLFGGFSSES
jgi:multiple sugar transport system permease protein